MELFRWLILFAKNFPAQAVTEDRYDSIHGKGRLFCDDPIVVTSLVLEHLDYRR